MKASRRRYQFTLRSLLLGTTGWAVVLAFVKLVGRVNAVVALSEATWLVAFVWAVCWITGRRVGFLLVTGTTLAGTAAAGSFCVCYHGIDVASVHLADGVARKGITETTVVADWCILGGLAGSIGGAIWSWRATRAIAGGGCANVDGTREAQGNAGTEGDKRNSEQKGASGTISDRFSFPQERRAEKPDPQE
jgi:hypothetical protein